MTKPSKRFLLVLCSFIIACLMQVHAEPLNDDLEPVQETQTTQGELRVNPNYRDPEDIEDVEESDEFDEFEELEGDIQPYEEEYLEDETEETLMDRVMKYKIPICVAAIVLIIIIITIIILMRKPPAPREDNIEEAMPKRKRPIRPTPNRGKGNNVNADIDLNMSNLTSEIAEGSPNQYEDEELCIPDRRVLPKPKVHVPNRQSQQQNIPSPSQAGKPSIRPPVKPSKDNKHSPVQPNMGSNQVKTTKPVPKQNRENENINQPIYQDMTSAQIATVRLKACIRKPPR